MPDIIADFHGTLYRDVDEGPLWGYVAKEAVTPLWKAMLLHPLRTLKFAEVKPVLEGLVKRYEGGEIGYDEIYKVYNRLILAHLPLGFVQVAIDRYADLPEIKQKLDDRVLRPVIDSGGKNGILSTGSWQFITAVLAKHYDPESVYDSFGLIVANHIGRRGRGSKFQLEEVHRNKPEYIERRFFRELGFNPQRTVYIGDNQDEEPAFEYVVSRGGRVVVPFYATDEFKNYTSGQAPYRDKVFVPENEQELSRFLQSLKAA